MKNWQLITTRYSAIGTAFALVLIATGCSTSDKAVGGPPGYSDIAADAKGDSSGGDTGSDTTVVGSVDFFLVLKSGDALKTADSVILSLAQDKYPDEDLFQADVVVETSGLADGASLSLTVGGKSVGTATVTANKATFEQVTIECGTSAVDITVTLADDTSISRTKSALINCSNACTVELVPPAKCVSQDVDPNTDGLQVTFIVKTTTPDCSHAYIKFVDLDGKAGESDKVPLNGQSQVTVTVTLSSKATGISNSTAQVTAIVEDQAFPDRPDGTSSQQSVVVNTEKPVVEIVSPSQDTVTLSDDANANASDGLQVLVTGSATSVQPLEPVEVSVNGQPVSGVNISANGTGWQTTLTFDKSQAYKIDVKVTNSCGLSGETSKTLTAFLDKASAVIAAPTFSQVLFAKDDSNPTTADVYDTNFTVNLSGASGGEAVKVFCRPNQLGEAYPNTPLGTATYAAGASGVIVPVKLDVNQLTSTVICKATVEGPNPSETSEVAFTVALPAPCLKITQPIDNALVNSNVMQLTATGSNLDGSIVEVVVALKGGASLIDTPVGKVQGGVMNANLALQVGSPPSVLPDGAYTLTMSTSDKYGNKISDSACSDVTRNFVVDTTAPVVTITKPSATKLDPTTDPDADPQTPGYQQDFEVSISGETGDSEVCLTVNGFQLPCATVSGNGTASFAKISLQPGSNQISVVATDKVGNASTTSAVEYTVNSDAPKVSWVQPAGSVVVATDTIAISFKATDKTGANPVSGAKVSVLVNGKPASSLPVKEGPTGTYSTTIGGLATGNTSLQVLVNPAAGGAEGVSSKITITRKVGAPTVQFNALKDGDVFNLQSTTCVAGVKNCSATLALSSGNAADGSNIEVQAVCGGATSKSSATVSNNAATVTGLILTHGTSCVVTATITDEAGQTAQSVKTTVTIDRVAPSLSTLTPNKTDFVNADDLNQNPADGLQVNLSVLAGGLAKNAKVTLEVVADDGTKTQFSSKDHIGASEGSTVQVPFGVVTLPDGNKVTLNLSVSDAAGNATSKSLQVKVSASAADVRLGSPTYIEPKSCTTSSQCGVGVCSAGKCATAWGVLSKREVSVLTIGIFAGAKLRLCSNNPAVSGNGSCATLGYNAVAAPIVLTSSGAVIEPKVIDGLHTFIAEALPPGADETNASNWVSSAKSSAGATVQSRRVLQDTIAPQLTSVQAPSAANVPAQCLAAASQVSSDNSPGGTFAFTATMANEDATVSLFNAGTKVGSASTSQKSGSVAVTLGEGAVTLQAVATDLVGNESAALSVGAYEVNTVAPTGFFAKPAKAQLTSTDSLDVVVTSQDSDINGQKVTLKDANKTVAVKTFAGGSVTFDYASFKTLNDGSHQLTADLVDSCGNTAIISTIPSTITVDTSAPTVVINSPSAGQVFKDSDDVDTTAGGYQVSAVFSTVDAAKWAVELGSNCDNSYQNCSGFSAVANGSITNPGGAEPAKKMTIPFGATKNYVVRVTATDAVGNVATTERGFTVNLSGCLVSIQGLPANGQVNNQKCATAGADCGSVQLPIVVNYVGPCGQITDVDLLVNNASIGKAKPSSNSASFNVTLTDGNNAAIEAKVFAGSTQGGTSGSSNLVVDLSSPKVSFIAGTVLGVQTPAGGSPVTLGTSDDLDSSQNDIQFHLLAQVKDSNLNGAQLTKVQNVLGSTADLKLVTQLPVKLSDASGTTTAQLQYITAPANGTIEVQATVVDSVGNIGLGKIQITTDSKQPGKVTLSAVASADVNPRRPSVKLNFTSVGADGGNQKTASSYQVRYSRKDITSDAEFDAACDASSLSNTVLSAPKAPGQADSVIVEGPDARAYSDNCAFAPLTDNGASKFYFALRAVDAAGNKGPVSNSVSTADVRLRFAKLSASSSPYANAVVYSLPRAVGDLNGDGKSDVLMRGSKVAKLCIFYGTANSNGTVPDITVNAATGGSWECFNNDAMMGVNVAEFIDVNGDGIDDLVIDYGQGAGKTREIRVYLGEKGKFITQTPAVRVTNISYSSNLGVKRLVNAGNFNGDTSAAGNAIDDFAFTITPTTSAPYDRVVVVPGNESWSTSSPIVIDVEKADDRKTNKILTIHRSDSAGTPQFGWYLAGGANWLPDGDGSGTQYDDLVITQYSTTYMVYIVKGRELKGDDISLTLTNTLSGSGSGDSTTAAIRPDPSTGGVSPSYPSLVFFDGDTKPDLMFTIVDGNQQPWVYWMRGKDLATQAGKYTKLSGADVGGVTGLRSN
ncbi:MAG: hypothetical protein CMH53_01110, partial [Myxococcales bacterium]|nr:hypothetical protein [Myxococcales bacterium]